MSTRISSFKSTIIIMISINVLGCCKKQYLNKSELSWLDSYKSGDTVIFQNRMGVEDTLVIKQKSLYFSYGDCFEISHPQYQVSSLNGYFLNNSTNSPNDSMFIFIEKQFVKNENLPNIMVKDLVFKDEYNIGHFEYLRDSITLPRNSSQQLQAYNFENGISAKSYGNESNKIVNFYWNKNHGLVAYQYVNGDTFYLSRKIVSK